MSTWAQPGRLRRPGRGLKTVEKSANSQFSKPPHTQKFGQPRRTTATSSKPAMSPSASAAARPRPRSASRRARPPAKRPRQRLRPTRSDRAPRGGSRYGLRPARLPPRAQHSTKEVNEASQELNLSTAGPFKGGFHPWLNIRSARWLRFGSAPTVVPSDSSPDRDDPRVFRTLGLHRDAPDQHRPRPAHRAASPSPGSHPPSILACSQSASCTCHIYVRLCDSLHREALHVKICHLTRHSV